jgi:hypothetical protein
MFFSHAFYKGTHEIVRDRKRWRDLLCEPPNGIFCFVITTVCKKHIIHNATMASDRDYFPVLLENRIVYIERQEFSKCLAIFETLYGMGFTKSSIRTGEYSTTALLKAHKEAFLSCEEYISQLRKTNADYLELCEFIAKKET